MLAAGGDPAAFERLYRRHHPRLHRVAAWMLGTNDVDDVVQEIFLRAWQKLASFRGDAGFATWLRRLGINVILRYSKKKQRAAAEIEGTDGHHNPKPLLKMDLETAVGKLPDGARKVFVLYDVEGYRHPEIARILGVSPHTSRAQLHRARTLLRGYL